MIKRQCGFNLLELMIALAIVGVLAAIAIPAYQNYTNRARVTDGISLAGAAILAVEEYYSNAGRFPDSNDVAGISDKNLITDKYVKSIGIGTDPVSGTVTVVYDKFGRINNGDSLIFVPTGGSSSISWRCYSDSIAGAMLPQSCRS